MSRPVTARPPGEHLTVLTRMLRQVEEDDVIPDRRRAVIKEHLIASMQLLQKEELERSKRNGGRKSHGSRRS